MGATAAAVGQNVVTAGFLCVGKKGLFIIWVVFIVPYWSEIEFNVLCIFFLQIYERDYLILG